MTIEVAELSLLVQDATRELSGRLSDPTLWVAFHPQYREKLPKAASALVAYIEREPELAKFCGGWFQLGGAGSRVEPPQLVAFLVRRTEKTSAAHAVGELQRYLDATEIPCIQRTMVAGVTAERAFEIESGTQYIPWELFRDMDDEVAQPEADRLWQSNPSVGPSGFIDTVVTLKKLHFETHRDPDPGYTGLTADLVGAPIPIMGLQLVSASGVSRLGSWLRVPEWCPIRTSSRAFWRPPQWAANYTLTDKDIVELPIVVCALRKLAPGPRDAVSLAIGRLGIALAEFFPVDKAVDLRIAYEVTFGIGDPDDNADYRNELRFRLALRAARFLGASAQERNAIFRSARDLYDLCSGAIHSGQISSRWDGEKGQQTLKRGAQIIQLALRKIVSEGSPIWSEVILA